MAQPISDHHGPAGNRRFRLVMVFAIVCAVVFAVGLVIGYHSVYRHISLAMHAAPAAMPQL